MEKKSTKDEAVILICKGLLAGITIGIGDMVNMMCENKVIGALLFSLGLLNILHNQLYLYTGKIGMIWFSKDLKSDVLRLIGGFVCNFIGVAVTVWLFSLVNSTFSENIHAAMSVLNEVMPADCFVGGIFCGILMTIAAVSYKGKNHTAETVITIFCVMVFILAGFRHCIANVPMMIFEGANVVNYIMMVLGNTVGSLVVGGLYKISEQK